MNKWMVSLSWAALICFCSFHSAYAQTAAASYTDLPGSYWAKNEILQLNELDILSGSMDMQFRPDAPLTKGQAAMALSKISPSKPAAEYAWLQTEQNSDEPITHKQLLDELATKFETDFAHLISIWPSRLEQAAINNISIFTINSAEDILRKSSPTVSRAVFANVLHRLLLDAGYIKEAKSYAASTIETSKNYIPMKHSVHLEEVPFSLHTLYLRAEESIRFKSQTEIDHGFARDYIYTYTVGRSAAEMEVTFRVLPNQDTFVFSKLTNPSGFPLTVDILQEEKDVAYFDLYRYDRYPLQRENTDLTDADMTSYPTGVLRFIRNDGTVEERMVGQSYLSKQLSMRYDNGEQSFTRELLDEQEALSYASTGDSLLSVYTLRSRGKDIVDQWYLNSHHQLFNSKKSIYAWMRETGQNHKKRNNWYTADGPYNKLADSTEPMPKSGQGYGRTLLMLKEDRALTLYHEKEERYFEDLVYNAFVNLKSFKKDKAYWETEVTSTYLKDLYGIHAPFIDTRFNEQIALFYYDIGREFEIPEANEPLRDYADLLVSQEDKGNIITVKTYAYYIADYFPINQEVTTHASMNHALGGMNILLMAYQEFQDPRYLRTARRIQQAIAYQQDNWIRDNGDIWYRISPDLTFKGDDYKHLTLEDLIDSYQLWQQFDPVYLPYLKQLIITKATFLSNENLGYTPKIKDGLEQIGLSEYLPKGDEVTDAL
ncbi:S-layer homology domain-containing protein [Sporosarcina cascadiensis]|uniref:S-layer homology domain-containing protein n=1 Tax=Sporosarcina cascadiensis TaxID=2660747 RepID=UPI00129AB3C9|nr:S-layer homology domain-containing protein [Sporosarcina cascadiensis]